MILINLCYRITRQFFLDLFKNVAIIKVCDKRDKILSIILNLLILYRNSKLKVERYKKIHTKRKLNLITLRELTRFEIVNRKKVNLQFLTMDRQWTINGHLSELSNLSEFVISSRIFFD